MKPEMRVDFAHASMQGQPIVLTFADQPSGVVELAAGGIVEQLSMRDHKFKPSFQISGNGQQIGLLVSEDMAARIKTKEVDLEEIVKGQLIAAQIVNDQRAALNPNQQSNRFPAGPASRL